jgi:enoyl-CoA hydratase
MAKRATDRLAGHWDESNLTTDIDELEEYVDYEVNADRSAAVITFTNPDELNAIPIAAFELVGDYVKDAEANDDVKVIIFKGEGPCFGSGASAHELGHYIGYTDDPEYTPPQRDRMLPDRNVLFQGFENVVAECLKPTICQVHSYCYGGHIQLALAADIIIAAPDAKFTHPAFRYLGPAPQNMALWIENLGVAKMKEAMLTQRPVRAEEAKEAGMVNKVVPEEDLDEWVDDYVDAISMVPLDGLMMGKAMMQLAIEARGKGVGDMIGPIGHGWNTNLAFEEGEWNFLRERYKKGLSQALEERDQMVAPYFRLGETAEYEE